MKPFEAAADTPTLYPPAAAVVEILHVLWCYELARLSGLKLLMYDVEYLLLIEIVNLENSLMCFCGSTTMCEVAPVFSVFKLTHCLCLKLVSRMLKTLVGFLHLYGSD